MFFAYPKVYTYRQFLKQKGMIKLEYNIHNLLLKYPGGKCSPVDMCSDCAKIVTSAEIWQVNPFGHIISLSLGSQLLKNTFYLTYSLMK